MIEVEVNYYAILREQRGLSREVVSTKAQSPLDLYEELVARHALTPPVSILRCAIGEEFVSMGTSLKDKDVVTFIPPVAGG